MNNNEFNDDNFSLQLHGKTDLKAILTDIEEDNEEGDQSNEEVKNTSLYPVSSGSLSNIMSNPKSKYNNPCRKEIEDIIRNWNEKLLDWADETTPLLGTKRNYYENSNNYSNAYSSFSHIESN